MDSNKLSSLLDKYYAGESSEAEEAQLREALKQPSVDESLKEHAQLFAFFEAEKDALTLGADFDAQLKQRLKQESSHKGFQWNFYLRIAATVLLAFTVGLLLYKNPKEVSPEDTYQDPQKAYEETKKALMYLSSKINEGTDQIKKIETFAIAQEKIEKQ